ncbi:sce7725 family protein [Companilactobacillus sp. HBUAS56275]|uniref:sce7725 family protein n=1 Tax=Companilactobacillus sp. HBUAS56275 TaxID=3109364 RepID=UPI002FF43255
MYFPMLKGKQHELLALRELLNDGILSENILPIIEPTGTSATLGNLLESFSDSNKKIAVIQNSPAANFKISDNIDMNKIKAKDNFIPALILDNSNDNSFSNYSNVNKMAIVNEKSDFNDTSIIDGNTYLVIEPNNRLAIRKLKNNTNFMVEMHEQFNNEWDRNIDYLSKPDELFTVEHLYYKEEGYCGFSDYSVIDSRTGFAAKAVAIHLVYFDENDELRIHHFVSDSNDDVRNPALKTYEALAKLIEFVSSSGFDSKKNDSRALKEFKELYKAEKYSGLGYIKKLSIKHHFEIMGRYLDRKQ